jgi:hypothetical protein
VVTVLLFKHELQSWIARTYQRLRRRKPANVDTMPSLQEPFVNAYWSGLDPASRWYFTQNHAHAASQAVLDLRRHRTRESLGLRPYRLELRAFSRTAANGL